MRMPLGPSVGMFSASRCISHPASRISFFAIASTYLSRPSLSVFHVMSVLGRIFATSDSISWNPGRSSLVPDMAASSYSFTMVSPWASAHAWASSFCWSMLASFCECEEKR